MNTNLNKTSKRLAQGAILALAVAGLSVPSFAATSTFDIQVDEPTDPCMFFTPVEATWEPDSMVTMSEVGNPSNANTLGFIYVEPTDQVEMAVSLNFMTGSSCGVDGEPVSEAPTGEVTATWTMPVSGDISLDAGATCDPSSPCSAAATTSIGATVSVAADATTGVNSGSVSIEWIPAD